MNHQTSMLTVATGMMHHHAHGYCGQLLCSCWFSTTSLAKVGTDLLKKQSTLSCFEHALGLARTCW
jgi:hypothetical protein